MSYIKICGLTKEEDIEYVNKYKPDFVGFVFAKSKREVTKEVAKGLTKNLCSDILPIGVFVNESIVKICEIVNECKLSGVQLHGDENNIFINDLREKLPKTIIIKAVKVLSEMSVFDAYEISADYILFDSLRGGSGETFEWELIKNFKKDYFLAGGLHSENIGLALDKLNPYAVDISSGVELFGVKNEELIAEFILIVRGRNEK